MAGALVLGEPLTGIVVALMYSGGQFLESFAQGRARREMSALLARAPKTASAIRAVREAHTQPHPPSPDSLRDFRKIRRPMSGDIANTRWVWMALDD
jgi:hypothetical protein